MTARGPVPKVVELQLPGLFCRAGGLAWQCGRRPVRDADGRHVAGINLQVSLDGVHIHDCSALFLGADGKNGVVQRWRRKPGHTGGALALHPDGRPRRYTQRGQVRVWLK